MLTADLIQARVRNNRLILSPADPGTLGRAREVAAALLATAEAHLGRPREELDEATKTLEPSAHDRILFLGLRKLLQDRCVFEAPSELDAPALRAEVFARAAVARRAAETPSAFDRSAVLTAAGEPFLLDPEGVEAGLFSDLPGAALLQEVKDVQAAVQLVERWRSGRIQAVLLRATRLTATIACPSAKALRAVFRKLKFLRLLFRIERLKGKERFRLEIEGPLGLFTQQTKYGLKLAMALPVLAACKSCEIEAEVRWGKQRRPCTFRWSNADDPGDWAALTPEPSEEVERLLAALKKSGGPWTVRRQTAILDVPGVGLCIPDLRFKHRDSGQIVYLEVLGFWSRDAVWKRVELAEAGLKHPVIFCASDRLRVSEKILAKEIPASLYVFKRAIRAAVVLERLDALATPSA